MLEELGGYCKGYVVDISKREEVYKAAEEVKQDVGDVSSNCLKQIFLQRHEP